MAPDTRKRRIECVALCILAAEASAAATLPAGTTIADAIAALESEGLRVFYSTDLVKPWMQVRVDLSSNDPARALDEILAPYGLATRPGPGGSLLVVRDARPSSAARASTAAARPPPPPEPEPEPLEEIVVAASRYELGGSPGASHALLPQTALEHLPDLGDDSVRAVARLPGTATNGIGALPNVRGGETGETLVRLDGLRLYEPFHLNEFQAIFSTLDPRAIRSIDVYTGGFPAAYGDRMSGVVDVHSIDAPADLYHELGVSFFNSSVLSTGRFARGSGEWVASARRSNLDFLYDTFSRKPDRPNYSDAFAKLSYELGDRLTLTANVLASRDDIVVSDDVDREETARARRRDAYRWLRLDHSLRNGFEGVTWLAHTTLDSERTGTTAKEGISRGELVDVRSFAIDSVRSDWSKAAGDRLLIQFGAEAARYEGEYDYQDEVELEVLFDAAGAPQEPQRARSAAVRATGRQHALFASARYGATGRFTVELGLRWDEQALAHVRSATISPRVGLRYALGPGTSVRAGWGRFFQSQAINELQVGDGVETFFAPQRSEHAIVGIEHLFPRGIAVRAEAYEKSAAHLRPRFENLLNELVLLPELKPDRVMIAPQSARARGLEVLVDGEAGDAVRWWLGYTWSQATDRIAGEDVPRSWDQTHALTAGLDFDTPTWNAGVAVLYRSGWPTTDVAPAGAAGGSAPLVALAPRNTATLGSYGSVDVRVTRKIELARSTLAVSLEVANLFDRENPCCFEYELDGDEEAAGLVLEPLTYMSRIPSVGVLWKF